MRRKEHEADIGHEGKLLPKRITKTGRKVRPKHFFLSDILMGGLARQRMRDLYKGRVGREVKKRDKRGRGTTSASFPSPISLHPKATETTAEKECKPDVQIYRKEREGGLGSHSSKHGNYHAKQKENKKIRDYGENSGHMAREASLHPISEIYMWNDCELYPASM
ncbi:hypothetical protein TNCV_2844991 [Trichonephila clavipes]|nr:hypothetical protein TNCV_2844991 [Trichonephila clavipes]